MMDRCSSPTSRNINGIAEWIFCISVFGAFIISMYPWFAWGNNITLYLLPCYIGVYAYALIKRRFYKQPKYISVFLSLLFCYVAVKGIFSGMPIITIISRVNQLVVIYVIASQPSDVKNMVFEKITKWFAVLLLTSIIGFIAYWIGVSLPHGNIIFLDGRYDAFNYYFFVVMKGNIGLDYFRFQSIFLEPGHMNMGLALLIIANKFNVKNKYVLVVGSKF